jgi:phosphatidylglycerophosphate synthase
MRAVLLATTSGAQAQAGNETVAERLVRQLRRFSPRDVTVITRGQYRGALPSGITIVESSGAREDLRLLRELITGPPEPVLLATADALLADTAVSAVLSDPTRRSGVLVGPLESANPLDVPVHRDRGMVLSVSTGFHITSQPNGVAAGLMKVSAPYVDDLRAALDRIADEGIADLTGGADAWTLTLLALTRGGTKLTGYAVPGLRYGRVAGDAGARQLLADIEAADEEAVRLDLCVKSDDDLFATYSISSYSRKLVTFFAKVKLTPVAVTWLSILLALVAAGLFAQASRAALIGGALAMYASFVMDCVDGQLARFTHRFSAFGGWLDMIADRAKEYLIYAGLAWGAAEAGHSWAWPLAISAITLQVARHMMDTWYGTLQDTATLRKAEQSLSVPEDRFAGSDAATSGGGSLAVRVGKQLGRLSAQFTAKRRSPSYWFKRTIVFPVGERWLVMGVGAALFDGRIALAALLVWQLIALAYTLAGRTLRSWAAKVPVLAREDVSTHRDDGLLVRLAGHARLAPLPVLAVGLLVIAASLVITVTVDGVGRWAALAAAVVFLCAVLTAGNRHDGPLDWLVPAALRAGEYGLVICCGLAADVPIPLIFAVLSSLALYHYDLAARIDKAASPLSSRSLGLGWDGRVLVLLIALTPGITVWLFWLLAVYMALVFLGGALLGRLGGDSASRPRTAPRLSAGV